MYVCVFSQAPAGNDFVENVKHKMWLKISLDNLEVVKCEYFKATEYIYLYNTNKIPRTIRLNGDSVHLLHQTDF